MCLWVAIAAGSLAAEAAATDFRLLRIDGYAVKWGAPVAGAGAEVSYGFATRAERFDDAINCRSLAPLDRLAHLWGRDEKRLSRIAAQAFAMWSVSADVTFRRAGPNERPDILIGAQGEPNRIAFANVWHDPTRARRDVAPLTRAVICFNPEAVFVEGGTKAGAEAYDFSTVLAHEIGHAIGLDHPGASGALMGFSNQGAFERLRSGDAAGGVALYGARAKR